MTLRSLLALLGIAIVSAASTWLVVRTVETELVDARLVNLAGRQRMLSQRGAAELLRARSLSGAGRETALAAFADSLRQFDQNHEALLHGPAESLGESDKSPALMLVREGCPECESLSHAFIDEGKSAMQALAAGEDRDPEAMLRTSDALLAALDLRMAQLQALGEANVSALARMVLVLGALTVLGLFAIALFVFRPMVDHVSRNQEHLERLNRELERLATTDKLTGALNRRTWDTVMGREQAKARRDKLELGVIMADLDHFKRVNDEHGHQRGDEVLCEFTRRLMGALRASDLFFRWGGEEFVVVLPGSGLAASAQIAEKLRLVVAAQPFAGGLFVTASFGVAATRGAEDMDRVLKRADLALYAAKAGGRNRVEIESEQAGMAE